MLPLVVRARLENWSIDRSELQISQDTSFGSIELEGHFSAKYRGFEVLASCYRNGNAALKHHCLHAEISALAQTRHPNIIGFIGASIDSQSCIVVTEHMSGGSLDALFLSQRQRKPLWRPPKAQALDWALDLVRAVNYLHQSDPTIIHRDLRPQHLHVSSTGVLKVAGFGQCLILTAADRDAISRTATASPAAAAPQFQFGADLNLEDAETGEPPAHAGAGADFKSAHGCGSAAERAARHPYVAPELVRDPGTRSPAADIYSVAMCLWFIRVGRDPDVPAAASESADRRQAAARIDVELSWPGGPPQPGGRQVPPPRSDSPSNI